MVGKKGFNEILVHEMGHVAMGLLIEMYGLDYVRDNLCEMFGASTSQWDSPSIPWEYRVVEAAAETFKDFAYPGRLYNNRTQLKLPISLAADFMKLFWGHTRTPYWDYSDGYSPFFWTVDNFHSSGPDWTFVNGPSIQRSFCFATPEFVAANPNHPSFVGRKPFLWPIEGDTIRLRWNFNVEPYEPLPIGATFGLHEGLEIHWSDYDPTYEAKIQLAALFYPIGLSGSLGALLDEQIVEVNPVNNSTGYGTVDITIPSGLPAQGFEIALSNSGADNFQAWEHPRTPPAYDGTSLPWPLVPQDAFTSPYTEWRGGIRLTPWPIPTPPWPYDVAKPTPGGGVIIGGGGGGIV
jgi:hypothetical protein